MLKKFILFLDKHKIGAVSLGILTFWLTLLFISIEFFLVFTTVVIILVVGISIIHWKELVKWAGE